MNLLITSIGKRVELITHLKKSFRVIGCDASDVNAARHFTDSFYRIPRCSEPDYIDALLKICEKEKINAIIPLYEAEFPILNEARAKFEALSVHLILSDANVISVCKDKYKTAEFFKKHEIPAPITYQPNDITKFLSSDDPSIYPLIIKPLDGMGSANVFKVNHQKELSFFTDYVEKPIVQSMATGTEYTIDALCDEYGTPVYVVPRIRLEVRSGEVVKSKTVKEPVIIEETLRLLGALNSEGRVIGPMTIQCFLSDTGEISFIEINSRFGGGVPLSFAAGADYASALSDMINGRIFAKRKPIDYLNDYEELTMLRYDSSVFES